MKNILKTAAIGIVAVSLTSCGIAAANKKAQQEEALARMEASGKTVEELMASDNLSRMQIHYLHDHAMEALKVQLPDDAKRYYKMARELYKALYYKDDEITDFMNQWQREFRSMKLI